MTENSNTETMTSEHGKAQTKGPKPFVIKTTSKQLIADLKKLQAKHGVFYVCTLNTKELVEGRPAPADLALVKIRNKNNELDHAILTDNYGAAVIQGTVGAMMAKEITEAEQTSPLPESETAMKTQEPDMDNELENIPEDMPSEDKVVQLPKKGSAENPLGY